jgi:hypothetical protein
MVFSMRSLRPCSLVLALWLGGTGCSVLFVEAPPADYAKRRSFTCSTSRLAPLGDTTLATILGIATANMIVGASGANDSQDLVSAVLVTTGIAASAIRGFAATSDCREAKRTFEERFDNYGSLSPFPVLPPGSDPWLAWGPAPPVAPAPAPPPNSDTKGSP